MPASNNKKTGDALKRATELLQMVGLSDRENAYPKQLSAGEFRRVAIAHALTNKPEILLADEPTADMDELTEAKIVSLLRQIHKSGVTILMVTHNMDLVPFATRALKVEKGIVSPMNIERVETERSDLINTGPGEPDAEEISSIQIIKPSNILSEGGFFSSGKLMGLIVCGISLAAFAIGLIFASTIQSPDQDLQAVNSFQVTQIYASSN
jgi:energy-coupling factor transporter ATP-binding protein EcfA2